MRKHQMIFVALAATVILLAGCVYNPTPAPPPPPPPPAPLNDSPEGAIKRFVWAYQNKKGTEYEQIFTEDFTFEFSTATDPELAQQYQNGWFKLDEKTSARHLFEGFTDDSTGYHPPASSIALTLAKTTPSDDTEGRDPTKFKVLATRVDGVITVPPTGTQTEDTRYVIDNNLHRFFLVRGDAALDVNSNPTVLPPLLADSTRWYIYRWIDETAGITGAPSGGLSPASASPSPMFLPTSWARVKAINR
jgi:hypothetical protein